MSASDVQPKGLNLYQKLAAITGEIGSVAKGGTNREQGYSFIEYAAVAGALRTLFGKYGVMCIPSMGERDERELVTSRGAKGVNVLVHFDFTFINADKPEEREIIPWIGEASDYGDKATNKAATAALKYCLMRTFNVSEKGDEDPDSTTIDRGKQEAAPPKKLTIQDAIANASAEMTRKGIKEPADRKAMLLKIAGVTEAGELKASHLNHVLEVLNNTTGSELRGYLDVEQTEEAAK